MITTTADFRLFWTSFDPLDLASGSIDVLGFQAVYIALADKLLPGFTTVTTSPRYVSMLCAAVAAAEAAYPGTGDATIRIRQARMGAVKSYERAWALACGLAARNRAIGDKTVNGLRGIRYVLRRLDELSNRERSIRTNSFNLLANQVRYGGITTITGRTARWGTPPRRSSRPAVPLPLRGGLRLRLRPPLRSSGTAVLPNPNSYSPWYNIWGQVSITLDAVHGVTTVRRMRC